MVRADVPRVAFAIVGAGHLWRSVDRGTSWRYVASDRTLAGVAPDPHHPGDLWIASTTTPGRPGAVLWSSGGGRPFLDRTAGLRDAAVWALAILDGGDRLVTTMASGAFARGTSGAWTPLAPPSPLLEVASDPRAPHTVLGEAQPLQPDAPPDFVRSDDGGATWDPTALPLPVYAARIYADPVVAGRIFALSGTGRVARSIDGGRTWGEVGRDVELGQNPVWVQSSADPDRMWILGTTRGFSGRFGYTLYDVATSTDGGLTWQASTPSFDGPSARAADPFDAGGLWELRGGELRRSEDDGLTWTAVAADLPLGDGAGHVPELVPDPHQPGALYLRWPAVQSRIARSVDGGATWTDLALPWWARPARLQVDPAEPGVLYAVGNGIFRHEE